MPCLGWSFFDDKFKLTLNSGTSNNDKKSLQLSLVANIQYYYVRPEKPLGVTFTGV